MKKIIKQFKTSISVKISIVLISVMNLSSCGYSVINDACPNCETTEIRNSDLILVTNSEGESNVFSKSRNKFLLSNWYPAEYDEGVFYDDITFTVGGEKIQVAERNYALISDDYLLGESEPEQKEKNCAVISAPSRPGSVSMRICKDEFANEAEWKARIEEIKEAKSKDWQLGESYSVYVNYE